MFLFRSNSLTVGRLAEFLKKNKIQNYAIKLCNCSFYNKYLILLLARYIFAAEWSVRASVLDGQAELNVLVGTATCAVNDE